MTAPKELVHVRQSLLTLIDLSPIDAFSVMIDDCRGSEEETGASRRNILEFLRDIAAEKRKVFLESGEDVEAEAAFLKGFIEVLKTTGIAESRLILGFLLPLSIVSGGNAIPTKTTDFVQALTGSLSGGSATALAEPLVGMMAILSRKGVMVDAVSSLDFLAKHGDAVVVMAMKGDPNARDVVEALKVSLKSVDAHRRATSAGVSIAFCQTVLKGLAVSFSPWTG